MPNPNDEQVYLEATQEVDSGTQAPALWAKAMALAEGDEEKARYRYIELRVEELSEAPTPTPPKDPASSIDSGGVGIIIGIILIGFVGILGAILIGGDGQRNAVRAPRVEETAKFRKLTRGHVADRPREIDDSTPSPPPAPAYQSIQEPVYGEFQHTPGTGIPGSITHPPPPPPAEGFHYETPAPSGFQYTPGTGIPGSITHPPPPESQATQQVAVANNLIDQAIILAGAMNAKDYATVVDYLPDRVVQSSGGRAAIIEGMRQTLSRASRLDITTVGPARGPVCNNQTCLAIVLTTSVITTSGQTDKDVSVTRVGFVLAESIDNGAAWKFIDGNPSTVAHIKSRYPSLARQLRFPQSKMICGDDEFAMTFIQVNGKWVMDEHTRTVMLSKIESKSRTDPAFRERWKAAMERVRREQSR